MEEFEDRAEAVLEQLPKFIWDGDRPPIPIDAIADSHFGLHVHRVSPAEMRTAPGCPPLGAGESLSGLLLPSRGEIWVNAEEAEQWPERERFTIAHEVGHYVLHATVAGGQQALFCRKPSVDPPPDEPAAARPPLPEIEREANAFAAALLMPAAMVEHYYRRTGGDFHRLCKIFSSSGAAMGRRLHAVI